MPSVHYITMTKSHDTPRSGNDASPSVEQLRRIDAVVQRNRERLSATATARGHRGAGRGGKWMENLEKIGRNLRILDDV